MSELHQEITELFEAGINLHDIGQTFQAAQNLGCRLVVGAMEHDLDSFLGFVDYWFGGETRVEVA